MAKKTAANPVLANAVRQAPDVRQESSPAPVIVPEGGARTLEEAEQLAQLRADQAAAAAAAEKKE